MSPGTSGSQKLSARKASVAESAAVIGTSASVSVATEAASNGPMPAGTMLTVRKQRRHHVAREDQRQRGVHAQRQQQHPHRERVAGDRAELPERRHEMQARPPRQRRISGGEEAQAVAHERHAAKDAHPDRDLAARDDEHRGDDAEPDDRDQHGEHDHQRGGAAGADDDRHRDEQARDVGEVIGRRVDHHRGHHHRARHPTLLEAARDDGGAADAGRRQRLVDEQLGERQAPGRHDRHVHVRGAGHDAPVLALGEVGHELQRDREEEPGRLGGAQHAQQLFLLGQVRRDRDDRREQRQRDEPGPDAKAALAIRGHRCLLHASGMPGGAGLRRGILHRAKGLGLVPRRTDRSAGSIRNAGSEEPMKIMNDSCLLLLLGS